MPDARWFNSLGEEVNLDDIDREYALNILTMVLWRRGRDSNFTGQAMSSLREDALVQKLRDVVLHGREKTGKDKTRAMQYNIDNVRAGKKFRAPVN